jgi:two-component system chemotaxis sensor kinase CheA
VGSSKFIFPLDAVVEVIENRPTVTILLTPRPQRASLRGQVLPVVSLRSCTRWTARRPSAQRRRGAGRRSALRRRGRQLLGQHQTVIKPLGRMFRSLRGMSGSSILGNGEVALIFDVPSLSQLAAEPPAIRAARVTLSLPPVNIFQCPRTNIMTDNTTHGSRAWSPAPN